MPNITKEQIIKINKMCNNGWKLNIDYYLYHNKKTLVKVIWIDEQN